MQPHRLETFKLSTDPDFVALHAASRRVPPGDRYAMVRDVVGLYVAPPAHAIVLYVTHKTPPVRGWLVKRPRWHVHLTPTSSSWLNQVERFFALLTDKQIKRGAHRGVAALQAAIQAFVEQHNAEPKPFRWTKSADDILASIERFCTRNTPATAK